MATIDFLPNRGKKVVNTTKPQTISLRYRIGRQTDFMASIGAKVLIKNWNETKQEVKNITSVHERHEINNLISNLKNHFKDFTNENLKNGYTPNYDEVKNHFKLFFTTPDDTENKVLSFFQFVDKFISDAKTKPNQSTKKLVSKNTIKDYVLTRNTLQSFNDEAQRFDFNDIDLDWYYNFCEWCNLKGFKDNYKGKHIKTLKTFLNSALEQGYTENINHKKRRFSVFREETDNIYLSLNELENLWNLDLSNNKTLERARDLFLIGCYTGLRFGDYNKITSKSFKNVNGTKMFLVKTQKTNKPVAIPVHPIVDEIFTKYDEVLPKMFNQKINDNIKIVAQKAELNNEIEISETIGGLEVLKTYPKYKLVTSHTARRSFCTNAYLKGMDSHDIMQISGHTTEKNFLKYIKVTAEQRAIKMSKHPFFSGQSNNLKAV